MNDYKPRINTLLFQLCIMAAGFVLVSSRTIFVNNSSPKKIRNTSCWTEESFAKPCATLGLGLLGLKHFPSETELIIEPGVYRGYDIDLNDTGDFSHLNNVTIKSGVLTRNVTIMCSSENSHFGLSFVYSNNITIQGIVFYGCEEVRNSTSMNGEENIFLRMNVSLYFLYCTNVKLIEVQVRNISGTGVIMYNVVGTSTVEACHIENCGNGGLYVEYSYCVPVPYDEGIDCLISQNSNVDVDYTVNGSLSVINSCFNQNIANLSKSEFNTNTFILPHKQDHSAFGRGGGFSVFYKGNATGNTILIENCNFTNNQALWGGGIFAEFQDSVNHNNFTVHLSHIENNRVQVSGTINQGTGGGGSRVGFIYFEDFFAYANNILFDECSFESNEGYYGGGLSMYSARQPSEKYGYNSLTLRKCNFTSNKARIGSAVDLSAWHPSNNGAVLTPLIEECKFHNNYYPRMYGGLIGIGAVYVDTLHANFKGENQFVNNNSSALAVTGGYIVIESNSMIMFCNNSGRNGGGVALLGNTFIIMNENSNLTFINNSATYHGGAIYFYSSGERDLLSSRDCFIRYYNISASPNDWESFFLFEGNKASNKPNSIFTSSVLPCLWGGAFGNANVSTKDVFRWKNWMYTDNTDNVNSTTQIQSSPFYFFNQSDSEVKELQIPGKLPINLADVLRVRNELENDVTDSSVFIASFHDEDGENHTFENGKSFTYISHEDLYLYTNSNGNVSILLQTLDPVVIEKVVKIQFKDCPPGFKIEKGMCQCNKHLSSNLICNQTYYESYAPRGVWYGKCESGNDCVGLSPYMHAVTTNAFFNLTSYNSDSNDSICESINRTGILCGECVPKYCLDINSDDMKCISVNNGRVKFGPILYIVTEFLPVTLFFAFVFIFSTTVTSGPLNSFVFFAQVINSCVKIRAEGKIPLEIFKSFKSFQYMYELLYNIWNLDFKKAIPISYCLRENMNDGLLPLSLGFVTAFFPLVLLTIFIVILFFYNRGNVIFVRIFRPMHNCFSRLKQFTGLRQSIIGGFAIFITISYTKFVLISNLLLAKTVLYDSAGKAPHQEVFHYNGNKKYPSDGIGYIATAGCVIATFVVIPPLLLIYPTLLGILRKLFVCEQCAPYLGKLHPGLRVQVFLNEFNGCYKDGSTGGIDCRWFASFYFCLRIIVFTVSAQIIQWDTQYLALIILFLVTAFLFSIFRPYRYDWFNSLDTVMFINLAAICTISLFNLQHVGDLSSGLFALQMVLMFLPVIYCLLYYIWIFFRPLYGTFYRRLATRGGNIQNRTVTLHNALNGDSSAQESDMEDSTHVQPFLDYVGNRKRATRSQRNFSWRSRVLRQQHDQEPGAQGNGSAETTPLLSTKSEPGSNLINSIPSSNNPNYGLAKDKPSTQ